MPARAQAIGVRQQQRSRHAPQADQQQASGSRASRYTTTSHSSRPEAVGQQPQQRQLSHLPAAQRTGVKKPINPVGLGCRPKGRRRRWIS